MAELIPGSGVLERLLGVRRPPAEVTRRVEGPPTVRTGRTAGVRQAPPVDVGNVGGTGITFLQPFVKAPAPSAFLDGVTCNHRAIVCKIHTLCGVKAVMVIGLH